MDKLFLEITCKKSNKGCEQIRNDGLFFENIADALNIARSQIKEIDEPPTHKKTELDPIISAIDKDYKENLKNCWDYHKDILKESEQGLKKNELDNYLDDVSLNGWEDVGYFIGYLNALTNIKALLLEKLEEKKS